jgi:hypothetical protein
MRLLVPAVLIAWLLLGLWLTYGRWWLEAARAYGR